MPALDNLKRAVTQIGTICVRFVWVTIQGTSANQHSQANAFTKLGAIPEKALKGRAVSNQTECGPREAVQPFTALATNQLYGGKPFAEFHFKYRSRTTSYLIHACRRPLIQLLRRGPQSTAYHSEEPESSTARGS